MLNGKAKCVFIIVVGILFASFLGVATFQPKANTTDSKNNNNIFETSNDINQIDKSLRNSGAVPANYEWYRTVAKEYFDEGFGVAIDSLGKCILEDMLDKITKILKTCDC